MGDGKAVARRDRRLCTGDFWAGRVFAILGLGLERKVVGLRFPLADTVRSLGLWVPCRRGRSEVLPSEDRKGLSGVPT